MLWEKIILQYSSITIQITHLGKVSIPFKCTTEND
jgi:hypothetical protein